MLLRRHKENQRVEMPADVVSDHEEVKTEEVGGETQTGADPETLTEPEEVKTEEEEVEKPKRRSRK